MMTKGPCYPASEALYHLLGGKAAGLTPQVMKVEKGTHWFLRDHRGNVLDPTYDLFDSPLDYSLGKGCDFLTKKPSKRAREFMRTYRRLARSLLLAQFIRY